MAKFILKIEMGKTNCADCPFSYESSLYSDGYGCNIAAANSIDINCGEYDLSTMKVTEKMEE